MSSQLLVTKTLAMLCEVHSMTAANTICRNTPCFQAPSQSMVTFLWGSQRKL